MQLVKLAIMRASPGDADRSTQNVTMNMDVARRAVRQPVIVRRIYRRDAACVRNHLERVLRDNILPFWVARGDRFEEGGYPVNFDIHGASQGERTTCLVPQARMLWFYSRIARSRFNTQAVSRLAHSGFRFLRSRMWDNESGGFFWTVDSRSAQPVQSEKVAYGHAFALYAMSEYAAFSGDGDALSLCTATFDLADEHLRQGQGYRPVADRDWRPLTGPWKSPFIGIRPDRDSSDTQIHLLEALTNLYRVVGGDRIRCRMEALIDSLSSPPLATSDGLLLDDSNERPTADGHEQPPMISYGHSVEFAWILLEATAALGEDLGPAVRAARAIVNRSFEFAFDERWGVLAAQGRANTRTTDGVALWWVQAEALLATCCLHACTAEASQRRRFESLLAWITTRQVDWNGGEWFAKARAFRSPSGPKGSHWKTAYHNARAMLTALEIEAGAHHLCGLADTFNARISENASLS